MPNLFQLIRKLIKTMVFSQGKIRKSQNNGNYLSMERKYYLVSRWDMYGLQVIIKKKKSRTINCPNLRLKAINLKRLHRGNE